MSKTATFKSLDCLVKHPNSREIKRAVIFLHGYGSNAQDLFELCDYFSNLKDTIFISANAPSLCDIGIGRQWFPLSNKLLPTGEVEVIIEHNQEIIKSSDKLISLIKEIKDSYNIHERKIGLFGFSQGGILSLFATLHKEAILGAVVCHSGLYYSPDEVTFNQNQNLLLIHGDKDEVLSLKKFEDSIKPLNKNSIKFEQHIEPKLSHGINSNTMSITEKFLLKYL